MRAFGQPYTVNGQSANVGDQKNTSVCMEEFPFVEGGNRDYSSHRADTPLVLTLCPEAGCSAVTGGVERLPPYDTATGHFS